jgi:parvulin-like peptidyl-prolyl isomerase
VIFAGGGSEIRFSLGGKMFKHRRFIGTLLVGIMLIAALAACNSDDDNDSGFVHIEDSAVETQAAQTAEAISAPTTTVEAPPPPPLPLGTPYTRPTDPPDYDGSVVITRVGSDEITLDDYRSHVRFDRFRFLFGLANVVQKYGPEQILDLTKPENEYVAGLLSTLAESYSFGSQSYRLMVIEHIVLQEAIARQMEVEQPLFDAKLAEYLGMILDENGDFPPEFDERYARFIDGLDVYADMTEEEFLRIVRARALYEQLEFEISHEPGVLPKEKQQITLQLHDTAVPTQEEAQQIADRLRAGEDMITIVTSLGYTPTGSGQMRTLKRGESGLPADLLDTLFSAQPGDVIGPVALGDQWYVALIGEQNVEILSPDEVDQIRNEYFLNWIEAKMDDPDYLTDFENWESFTPQDPLPQDVSPLLREENFTLPEGSATGAFGSSVTATPEAAATPGS